MLPTEGSIASEQIRRLTIHGHVGFDTLADQLVNKAVRGITFNILCIGETGIGKSTLLDSLFNTNFEARESSHDSSSVKLKASTFHLQENQVQMKLTIVESVGYGDQINRGESYKPILEYVDTQFESYLQEELSVPRCLSADRDTRIHACLYFICPTGHGLKPMDILCMKKLDQKVNLIPIISMADSISSDELPGFKKRILEDLDRNGINIYEFPAVEDERVLADPEIISMNAYVPFAVVGSNEFVMVGNKMMRARQYPWGTVQVENEKHCDFTKLREVLIRSNMEDLREQTNYNYEGYRKSRLEQMGFSDIDPGKSLLRNYGPGQQLGIGGTQFASQQQELEGIEKEAMDKFMTKVKEKELELKRGETEHAMKWDRLNLNYEREKKRLEESQQWLEDDIEEYNRCNLEAMMEQSPPGAPADSRHGHYRSLGALWGRSKRK